MKIHFGILCLALILSGCSENSRSEFTHAFGVPYPSDEKSRDRAREKVYETLRVENDEFRLMCQNVDHMPDSLKKQEASELLKETLDAFNRHRVVAERAGIETEDHFWNK